MVSVASLSKSDEQARANPQVSPQPASVSVVSALCQTTVSDSAISVSPTPGPRQFALYANPFADAAEELLVIDAGMRLTQVARSRQARWQQVEVADDGVYVEVVVATHLDGTPWTFALTMDNRIHAFELQADSTWRPGPVHLEDFGNWSGLQVQYLRDRPTTAWVFGRDELNPRLRALSPVIPDAGDSEGPRWVEQTLPAGPAPTAQFACGWQTPELGLAGPVPVLQLYVVDGEQTLTCYPLVDRAWATPVQVAQGVDRIIGVWSGMNDNLGVLFEQEATVHVWSPSDQPAPMQPVALATDFALHDAVVWQDARAMLHVYGVSNGELRVAHQTSWTTTDDGLVLPSFLSVFASGAGYVNITLPLSAGVQMFSVDAYPDAFPSQLVRRDQAGAEATYSIQTQDTTTAWWSEEKVSLAGGDRRILDRYVSTITVCDRYGAPVAGSQLALSAQSRVQVEIGASGTSWLLGPDTRVPVTTDALGRVTVRQSPAGLVLPVVQVDVPGVPDGATLDPGASVRTFLAGERPLPNHNSGFTAPALLDAKVDGDWLVPGWHDPPAAETLPTPEEVVTWCREVLSPTIPGQTGGWTLDLRRDRGPGTTGVDRLLRHETDGDLAAYLAALRELPSYGGLLPIPEVFVPDIWQGIADGALEVQMAGYVKATQTAHVFLSWLVDGIPSLFEVTLSIAEDTGAARYVEATFGWLGASRDRLVSWLSWGLGLDQVWQSATALRQGIGMLPALVTELADHFLSDLPDEFFADHEELLDQALPPVVDKLAGTTTGSLRDGPSIGADERSVVTPVVEGQEALRSPHLDWLRVEVDRLSSGVGSHHPPSKPTATPDDAWSNVWDTFTGSSAGASFAEAVDWMGADFGALLNPDDAATLDALPLTGTIDALDRNRALLALADTLRADLIALVESFATALTQWLDAPLEPGPEADLYRWVAAAAGQPSPPAPTQADLAILQVAYPLTLWFTSRTGAGPFPDGTFPSLSPSLAPSLAPSPGEPGLPEDVPPLWMVINLIKASLELYTVPRDFLFDTFLAPDRAALAERLQGFAVYRLTESALSALSLHASPWGDNDLDDTRWAMAGVETLTALIETYMAFRFGSSLNYLNLVDGAQGMKFLSFLGLARVWLSYRLWTLSPKTDFYWYEATSGFFRAFPDATAFMRAWGFGPDPQLRRLWQLKSVLDIWAHVVGASYGMFVTYVESQFPLTAVQVPDQKAVVGQTFSLQLQSTGGFTPYTWIVQGLPTGLRASADGLVTGIPSKQQTRTVSCQVKDALTPPVLAQMTFKITVNSPA